MSVHDEILEKYYEFKRYRMKDPEVLLLPSMAALQLVDEIAKSMVPISPITNFNQFMGMEIVLTQEENISLGMKNVNLIGEALILEDIKRRKLAENVKATLEVKSKD